MGKTSTKGHKGQKARSGGGPRPGYEGGQMPIHRRLPKYGFKSMSTRKIGIVNLADLDRFDGGAVIDMEALKAIGLLKGRLDAVKILGNGELSKAFTLKACQVSKTARQKIEAAGGTIEN
jgi:large subunit ribosomal protein L15